MKYPELRPEVHAGLCASIVTIVLFCWTNNPDVSTSDNLRETGYKFFGWFMGYLMLWVVTSGLVKDDEN